MLRVKAYWATIPASPRVLRDRRLEHRPEGKQLFCLSLVPFVLLKGDYTTTTTVPTFQDATAYRTPI